MSKAFQEVCQKVVNKSKLYRILSTCTHTGTLWTTEIIPYTKTMMPTTAAGNSQAV